MAAYGWASVCGGFRGSFPCSWLLWLLSGRTLVPAAEASSLVLICAEWELSDEPLCPGVPAGAEYTCAVRETMRQGFKMHCLCKHWSSNPQIILNPVLLGAAPAACWACWEVRCPERGERWFGSLLFYPLLQHLSVIICTDTCRNAASEVKTIMMFLVLLVFFPQTKIRRVFGFPHLRCPRGLKLNLHTVVFKTVDGFPFYRAVYFGENTFVGLSRPGYGSFCFM